MSSIFHLCKVCGFIYDDEVEYINFDQLDDGYVCPTCGADKDSFIDA